MPGETSGPEWRKSSSTSFARGDGGLMVELICLNRPSLAMLLWFTILPLLLSIFGRLASSPKTSCFDLWDSSCTYCYSSSTWLTSFSYWYVFKCILVLFLLTLGLWASIGCSRRPLSAFTYVFCGPLSFFINFCSFELLNWILRLS